MSNIETDAELHIQQKQDRAKDEVLRFINQYASANASQDLLNSIKIEVVPVNGVDRTIIRDPRNGNQIISRDQMLKKFETERPGYLHSERSAVTNDIIAEHQKKKDDLQQQVSEAAASGDFDLFKKLRIQQGATYR